MVYGDGDGETFASLAGCLDIAAHEMSHGVIENSANFIYQNQSGALSESFSDIFGAMVDRDDWTIGEDCTIASPGFVRDLSDPSRGMNSQPAHMNEYQNLPATEAGNYGGIHINSGIPNHAAYLIAEGLSAEGLGLSIGRAKTEQIFYDALTVYLLASSQFIDARRATIQAAEDRYGAGTVEVAAVIAAWDAVGVIEGGAVPEQTSPTDADVVLGADVLLYLYPSDGLIDMPGSEIFALYMQGIPTPFTGYEAALDEQVPQPIAASYTRPAIITTIAGTYVYFVGVDKNIYTIDLLSNAYTQLTTTADIWSMAVSPTGTYMAYTSTSRADDNIYVVNLDNGETSVHKIVQASYQEGEFSAVDSVDYADSLSFDFSGTKIVFDARFCQSIAGSDCADGGGYQYWSIGFLDIKDGSFGYPFPSQNPLINIGYPSFAYNNDYVIVMDMHDYSDAAATGNVYSDVMSLNTETQSLQKIVSVSADGVGRWGVPSFWGEDDFVVVQMPTAAGLSTYRVPMKSDGSGDYENIERLNNFAATMPMMHRVGARNVSVELQVAVEILDFGDVVTGSKKSLPLKITNIGNMDAEITNIVMSNSIFTDNAVNTTLPRGENITVEVAFSAGVDVGTQAGILTFHYGVDSKLVVSLTGTVVMENAVGLLSAPASLNFGEVKEGSKKKQLLEISNGSDEDVLISAVIISNSLFTNELVDTTVPAGGRVVMDVSYSADIAGEQTAMLAIQYNVNKEISVSLSALTVENRSKKSGGGT
ncbi:MAG: M4 family metallopeptidase, partial [Candidatus Marinimicrobia bacterium]|nr:M4 family metallopeptidase [Candidatus Neomarinimicrobiota bacterium]